MSIEWHLQCSHWCVLSWFIATVPGFSVFECVLSN